MAELLMGDEAVAVAAIDAGICGAFSYPGTPATEIFECVQAQVAAMQAKGRDRVSSDSDPTPSTGVTPAGGNGSAKPHGNVNSAAADIVARWSANEKVAYEEALGVSYLGGRALVSMKHVGLNVAADPFMSSALTGAVGGLVVAIADDPGMHSSQNEQDTRFYADFARVPCFEPCNQQEAYDVTREAFELSEQLGIPIVVRLVTRLAHSRSAVSRQPATERKPPDQRGRPSDWILMPVNARRRNRKLIEFQAVLVHHSEQSPFNKLALRGPKGIIACGIGHNYVKEAIGEDSDYSVLKISAYPIPQRQVRQIVDHCESILIVEEGYPLLETRLRGLLGVPGKTIQGRCSGELSPDGELSANLIKAALGMPLPSAAQPLPAMPNRPPSLCQGCPHCDTFKMITEALPPGESPLLFGDIGCYTLGALPPYDAVHTCVEMGASVGMGLGAAKAGAHPVICTIGDSTFTHSGMATLLAAAAENADMTVIIMDNAGVAMTGGQDAFITGEDFIRLLRGLGVDPRHIMQIDPVRKDHQRNVQILKEEIAYRGLSVIIATRPCIHLKRRARQPEAGAKEEQMDAEPRTRPGAAMEKVPL